jgi:hypothetical protein
MQFREGEIDYKKLENFQFHQKHSLYSLLQGKCDLTASVDKKALSITLQLHGHPHFPLRYIDAHKLTLAMIAITADSSSSRTTEHLFPLTRLEDNPIGEVQLNFPGEKKMKTFIIVLKCEGYKGKDVMNNLRTQGMGVVKVAMGA